MPYVFLVLAMALFAYNFLQKTRQVHGLQAQQAALQFQNDRTRQDNARLQRDIKWYQRTAYIREAARSLLGYAMPGDFVIQTEPVQQAAPEVRAAPAPPPAPPVAVWRQWWRSFFG